MLGAPSRSTALINADPISATAVNANAVGASPASIAPADVRPGQRQTARLSGRKFIVSPLTQIG